MWIFRVYPSHGLLDSNLTLQPQQHGTSIDATPPSHQAPIVQGGGYLRLIGMFIVSIPARKELTVPRQSVSVMVRDR